jgi:hypothetical protein
LSFCTAINCSYTLRFIVAQPTHPR